MLALLHCRWGYGSVGVLEQVVANYSAAGLPLECVWADIDYMSSRFQTMTFDEGAWCECCCCCCLLE